MAKKKTAPKTKKVVPAIAALVIAALILVGIALTAARVGSDKAVAPTAPESEPAAAGKNKVGDPPRVVPKKTPAPTLKQAPKTVPKPTKFLAR